MYSKFAINKLINKLKYLLLLCLSSKQREIHEDLERQDFLINAEVEDHGLRPLAEAGHVSAGGLSLRLVVVLAVQVRLHPFDGFVVHRIFGEFQNHVQEIPGIHHLTESIEYTII